MDFTEGMIVLYAFTTLELPVLRTLAELEEVLRRWKETMAMLTKSGDIKLAISQKLRSELDLMATGSQWASQMACLHILSCGLSKITKDEAEEYIRDLDSVTQASRGKSTLAPVALFFMLGSCAQRMGWWHIQPYTPMTSWETIELVVLMSLAPRTRLSLLAFLACRLNGGKYCEIDMK